MRVLVTGGAGFIGSSFIEYLLSRDPDVRVICLDNFNSFLYSAELKAQNIEELRGNPRFTVVRYNFTENLAGLIAHMRGVDAIVHLGGYAGVRESAYFPHEYIRNNIDGTLAVLVAAAAQQVKRVLIASSSAVYGSQTYGPFSESVLAVPTSVYGVTKRTAEMLGALSQAQSDMQVSCLRLFSVYGPKMRPDLAIAKFLPAILDSQPVTVFGDGGAIRDFTHISDVCAALYAALSVERVPAVVNIGCGCPITVNDMIETLAAAAAAPAFVQHAAATPDEMLLTHANIELAANTLGYRPQVAFADGIRDYVSWYKSTIRR